MTIGSALASAMSGLTASARLAEIASNNIANALNEGYAKKEAVVVARTLGDQGAGVRVQGVVRSVDQLILGDLRLATASNAFYKTATDFFANVEAAFGTAEEDGSIANRMTGLETALASAQSRPESDARLQAVADAAKWVANGLNDVADGIQTTRQAADARIAVVVDQLNSDLKSVSDLNAKITRFSVAGRDITALQDERQSVVDRISSVVPIRELPRSDGAIALFSSGGLMLLDGRAAEFGFSKTPYITADLSVGSGLSGLQFDGKDLPLDENGGRLGGGELSALFNLRDRFAPDAQAQLDGLARDLVERLQDPAVDPSLSGGQPGLFTDGGAAFAAANETGLSARISVNAAVVPEQGGALWRLRSGIAASSAGAAGDNSLLTAFSAALTKQSAPSSSALSGQSGSVSGLAAGISASLSVSRLGAERSESFVAARVEALKTEHLANGVDTDEEMQTLLLIEKAYAANAKVIQAADAMMQAILEI